MGSYDKNRLKPSLNFLTSEIRNAYKDGRSDIDVLYLINNKITRGSTNQLILFGPQKAFGAVNRDILGALLYGRRLPRNLIKIIGTTRQGATLEPKNNGIVSSEVIIKGVFQGISLIDRLFIIYTESTMAKFGSSSKPDTIQTCIC